MPTHSRGPPALFPVAGQVAGSHIATPRAAAAGPLRRIQRRTRLSHAGAAGA